MSSFSVLNNVSAMATEQQLSINQHNMQNTLEQLSTGSRINSGADDPAGLAITNSMSAQITALNQSSQNATYGVGQLQVADGALSQVTSLLNTAVTLASEAASGNVSSTQATALDNEFSKIKSEIDNIGADTTFNGSSVFSASTTSVFLSDGGSSYQIAVTVGALSSSSIQGGTSSGLTAVNLSGTSLTTASNASTALTDINNAITNVSSKSGEIGSTINQLQSAQAVISSQVQSLTQAQTNFTSANMPELVSKLSEENILNQTGMSALAQANSAQQAVVRLFQ